MKKKNINLKKTIKSIDKKKYKSNKHIRKKSCHILNQVIYLTTFYIHAIVYINRLLTLSSKKYQVLKSY